MRISRKATDVVDLTDDSALVARAVDGDQRAFEELYRRYAPSAQRVAQSVTGNPDDAADAVSEAFTRLLVNLPSGASAPAAFRPYLMAATRNAAIDQVRRRNRVEPTDVVDLDRPAAGAGPSDRVVMGEDSALVVQAFSELPERWRAVLWLTEIEGLPPREAAERLGLSPNGASQLAVRARAGLRERYLQAHLRASERQECQFTLEHLGAYVGGGLAPRDVAKVDQHLAGCATCTAAKEELEEVGSSLRRSLLPIPLILGGAAVGRWAQQAVLAGTGAGGAGAGAGGAGAGGGAAGAAGAAGRGTSSVAMTGAQKTLALLTAGLFTAGVMGAVTVEDDGARRSVPATTSVAQPPAPPPPADDTPLIAVLADSVGRMFDAARRPRISSTSQDAPPSALGVPPQTFDGGSPSDPGAPAPPPAPTPVAQVSGGGRFGPLVAGVAVGLGPGECTGVVAGPVAGGCQPPLPPSDGLVVSTGGQALPPQTVSVP